MQRIDVASASPTLPAPATLGTPGYFSEGNPLTSDSATVVSADFLNMVQEELMGVILAAAITPSKIDHGQLLQALASLFGISGTLAATGHIVVPVGTLKLIVNWGSGTHSDATGGQLVTFDQPFQNGPFVAFPSNRASAPPTAFHAWAPVSNLQMKIFSATAAGAPAGAGTAFSYIAVGI